MKKVIALTALIILITGNVNTLHAQTKKKSKPAKKPSYYVFMCSGGPAAPKYHTDTYCKGLYGCYSVSKVTITEALKTYKRKPCKICN